MASTRGKAKRPAGRRKGSSRRRGGLLGHRLVRRAIVAGWAVVVAVAVGFLLMRAMDERMPPAHQIAAQAPPSESRPEVAPRPSSPANAIESAPRVTARPVDRPA
ncbi:hypothetical protein, partial [Zavarzinia sp.]|uniref:hypothetical protein n=1 Tax=Zavarzinia sp. TaxID=2027920 RepID=UPI003BB5D192